MSIVSRPRTFQVATAPPFATAVSGSGRYLVDQYGAPFLLRSDSQWNLFVWGGGRSEAPGTPAGVFSAFAVARAAKGFNACLVMAVNSNQGGEVGPFQDGRLWDGVAVWGVGGIGDLNETYWARLDTLLSTFEANGITAVVTLVSSYTMYSGTAFAGLNTTSAATFGAAIGNRYKNRPNIIWQLGVDYFGSEEASMTALVNALRAAGDAHLLVMEYYAETSSRVESNGTTAPGTFALSDFDDIYTYQATYQLIEISYQDAPVRPAMFMNGHYDQSGTGTSDRKVMNDLLGWALTSGSPGFQYGSEGTWQWGSSTAYDNVTAETWSNNDFPAVMDRIAALAGWWDLVPDHGALGFITSARGTKLGALTPGGGGGGYDNTDPQNDYLTGAVTADGRLGLIYTPTSRTITIDTSKMQGGFTATWLDPVSGDLTSTTPGSSYTHPGNNAGGHPAWYLVLEG